MFALTQGTLRLENGLQVWGCPHKATESLGFCRKELITVTQKNSSALLLNDQYAAMHEKILHHEDGKALEQVAQEVVDAPFLEVSKAG